MTKDELLNRFIELTERVAKAIETNNDVLRQINDQNKLHKQAIDVNTKAINNLSIMVKEQTKSFNKMWYLFWIVVLALIILAGAEKVLKFI